MNTRSILSAVVLIGLVGLTSVELIAQSNWTFKSSMPTARSGLAACVVEGRIYAISGAPRFQVVTNRVEQYDHATDTYATKASFNKAITNATWLQVSGANRQAFSDIAWGSQIPWGRQPALAIDACLTWFFATYLKGEELPFPANPELINVNRK